MAVGLLAAAAACCCFVLAAVLFPGGGYDPFRRMLSALGRVKVGSVTYPASHFLFVAGMVISAAGVVAVSWLRRLSLLGSVLNAAGLLTIALVPEDVCEPGHNVGCWLAAAGGGLMLRYWVQSEASPRSARLWSAILLLPLLAIGLGLGLHGLRLVPFAPWVPTAQKGVILSFAAWVVWLSVRQESVACRRACVLVLVTGLAAVARAAAEPCGGDVSAPRTRETNFLIPGLRDYEFATNGDVKAGEKAGGSLRLTEEESFFPFVDRFGQYAHGHWPGKVGTDAELRRRAKDEERELAALPACAIQNCNRFGGWAGGPKLAATGMFRTQKVDGRWWLVDPDGRLFFSLGVDCVRFSSQTGVTGRERFFCELPERGDGLFADCWGQQRNPAVRGFYRSRFPFETFDFARANLIRKYGPGTWMQDASSVAVRRMRSWGLNTIGNWSSRELAANARIPYTDSFETRSRAIRGNDGFWRGFPDVFAPEFRANAESDARKVAARSGRDPWCLGWFVDNELSWGEDDADLARDVLASPDDQPAKVEFVRVLRERGLGTNDVPRAELVAFTRRIADRYFSVIRKAIKAVAPGRLYLGCRFAWVPPTVLLSAAEHCDVVTGNVYLEDPSAVRLPEGAVDRPLLSGEFHFGALDRGLLHAGLRPAGSQDDRARRFRRYVRAALNDPRFVGVHWFQWRDQPLAGRFDGECYQIGLVDVTDSPYPEMVAALRELAGELYCRGRLSAQECR